jgi:hypothetical protein
MVTCHLFHRRVRTVLPSIVVVHLLFGIVAPALRAQRREVATRTIDAVDGLSEATDVGPVPVSQPMHLTLRLEPTPQRQAALDQLLAAQITPTSSAYHHWLTPQQFAASYGATDDQIAATTTWLQSQGLAVDGVSKARTRIVVSGTADQVQRAFSVALRSYQVSGTQHYASTARPTVPQEVSSIIAEVSGLNDLPASAKTRVAAISASGLTTVLTTDANDPLDATAAAVDANVSPILTVMTSDCNSALSQADYEAYRALFRQASAQGITVVTSSTCKQQSMGPQSGDLAEATALITTPGTSPLAAIDARPAWQSAPGLPNDGLRHAPDLTTSSLDDFTHALSSILQQTDGGHEGNINGTLYSLASTPDLYTQPDGANGTWEPTTGLGTVNLQTLVKVFPRATGSITTTTSLAADQYSVGYGTPIKVTSSITPSSYAAAGPTGTVTFTSSQGTIGSAQLSNGTATFTTSSLSVGTYTVTANYSGDSNYAPSTSTGVVITVNLVNATLEATISPTQNVPYGATATVTATVKLPTSSAAPTGTVTATIEAVTGAVFNATLSPNPGGNTATANIVINAPKPQTQPYTVEVTCAGNQNFQCQTPVDLTFTTAKGNTITTVGLTPQSPQAGQPVTLSATINNAGNGTGTYSFSGNVTFYDNGVLIATVPVATNAATTSKTLSGNVQHSIVAKYSGDANWNTSTSAPQAVQPTLLPSTLTLTSNATATLAGVNLVFTATVFTTATNSVGPTGSVTFYDTFNGSVVQLGTPTPLTPNGPNQSIAIYSTTGLLAGTHSVYAVYNGDANFNNATSSTLAINLADFNLTSVPQSLTVKAGQNGKVVMLLGMVGGFNGTVTFGCTPPTGTETTCSFNPLSLTGGGSTTLTITTTAATVSTQKARLESRWNLFGGTALAALFCFAVPRRRAGLSRLAVLFAAICLTANLGCGAGTQSSADPTPTVTDPGTPLGTQVFTITAAGSDGVNTVRHTYQYQVTIQ